MYAYGSEADFSLDPGVVSPPFVIKQERGFYPVWHVEGVDTAPEGSSPSGIADSS